MFITAFLSKMWALIKWCVTKVAHCTAVPKICPRHNLNEQKTDNLSYGIRFFIHYNLNISPFT